MARKLCSICNLRSIGTGEGNDPAHARMMGYCTPCLTEGEWENAHSDYGHEAMKADAMNPSEREREILEEMEGCWICHPELNRATDRTPARKGHTNTVAKSRTSHAGCTHPRTPAGRAACRKAGGPEARETAPIRPQTREDLMAGMTTKERARFARQMQSDADRAKGRKAKKPTAITKVSDLPMPNLTPAQLASPIFQSVLRHQK